MKKVFLTLITALIACMAMQAQITEFRQRHGQVKMIFRVIDKSSVSIIGMSSASLNDHAPLVIPSTVYSPDGIQYNVVEIATDARIGGGFTKVTIPRSIKQIGPRAFSRCEYMGSVEIYGASISEETFVHCQHLNQVIYHGEKWYRRHKNGKMELIDKLNTYGGPAYIVYK
ncbi:MAG: hypothetical protein Q4B68_06980 [Bacteroidales bacterium]|nr:hypothetical protein [Bacteroidales bacterium]